MVDVKAPVSAPDRSYILLELGVHCCFFSNHLGISNVLHSPGVPWLADRLIAYCVACQRPDGLGTGASPGCRSTIGGTATADRP